MRSHPISSTLLPILRPPLIWLCVAVADRLPPEIHFTGSLRHRPVAQPHPWGFPPPLPPLTPLFLFLLLLLFFPLPSSSSSFLNSKGRRVAEPYTFICITWVNKAICLGTWDQWVALMPVSRLAGGDKRQHMCRQAAWRWRDVAAWVPPERLHPLRDKQPVAMITEAFMPSGNSRKADTLIWCKAAICPSRSLA